MKKLTLFLLLFAVLLATGCSYKIAQTVWYDTVPSSLEGQEAIVVNGLYFTDDNRVFMKTSVIKDTTVIVPAYPAGYGTYQCSGTLQKGVHISIVTDKKIDSKKLDYEGLITKDGMLLCASDSTLHYYTPVTKKKSK